MHLAAADAKIRKISAALKISGEFKLKAVQEIGWKVEKYQSDENTKLFKNGCL